MIIKSLSRKTASFRQLIGYFHKEKTADHGAFTHNLIRTDPDGAASEMEDNAKYLPKRRNGNVVYHEILSLPENKQVPIARQAAMLEDLVRYYVQLRCPNSLVYGKLHRDTQNLHWHLAISSNGVRERHRHWLSKADYDAIQKQVEARQIERYPQLGTEPIYGRDDREQEDRPHLTNREQSFKLRTGELSRKEQDHLTLHEIFKSATSEVALSQSLQKAGFALYERGRLEGVIASDGRKYRLKTLGLEPSLQTARQRMVTFGERQQALAELSPDQEHSNRRER